MESNVDKQFPAPTPYFLPEDCKSGQDVKVYKVHSPFTRPPPPPAQPPQLPSLSSPSGVCLPNNILSAVPVYDAPLRTPRAKFVSYEAELRRSPGLATCPSCRTRVTTEVTFKAGTFAWLMCLVFVLCGLVLGCCLIPFFVNHFKDAYHSCPRCRLVLHVHKKQCCK
ncbi:lipopolysaccharide-induced tumor necrosis factor-alpha factor homolog [Oreochromis aureus]|uniref:LITAF domain-containing protein n=1 Tax=Oreochromis aureus TaxID=47969 RepID=A0AAZ1XQW1_OREAU|nr:lipopolysaccharide-induced tumor necrosis factor-alpha factor homolog [Oreochromis aureus]